MTGNDRLERIEQRWAEDAADKKARRAKDWPWRGRSLGTELALIAVCLLALVGLAYLLASLAGTAH